MMFREGAYLTPPKAAITIVRNGQDHFDALRVTHVTLDEMFNALLQFGVNEKRTTRM